MNVEISRFGVDFIRNFAERIGPEGGIASLGLKENGYLFLSGTEDGARTLAELAAMQRSLGADRRVDDGTSTSPGAPQGTVAAAQPPAAPLTAREREVIGQAAIGLRDVEIAAALGISVRTVHAHLRSAYRKLGIAGRADLRGGPPSLPR